MEKIGIAFDIDGVIVDSEPLHFESLCRVVSARNIDMESLIGLSLPQTLLACGVPPEEHGAVEGKIVDYYVEHISSRHLRPGVQDVLDRLMEYEVPVGFVSTAPKRVCLANLTAALGERALSVPLVSGECVPITKPYPAPYSALGRLLKTPVSEMIAIEDTDIGICSAMSAGIGKLYGWPNSSSGGQTYRYADAVIQALNDIPFFKELMAKPS